MSDVTIAMLTPKKVLYCAECGMPPEFCEYGPDFETHCSPWLLKFDFARYAKIHSSGTGDADSEDEGGDGETMTVEQRLIAFYKHYMPEKLDGIGKILDKYAGKEEQLFTALVKKYGPEPADLVDEDDEDDNSEGMKELSISDKKKRRGAGAKKAGAVDTRVIIQKVLRSRKKATTIVVGMETVPGVKPNLKDVSQAFSRRFAGSSSVKSTAKGTKEVIIQGDHTYDVAEFIVKQFKVDGCNVFLDDDGEFVPYE